MGIMVANLLGPHLKRGARVKPSDFMPEFGPPRKQTAAVIEATMHDFAAAHNAMINQRKGAKPSQQPSAD